MTMQRYFELIRQFPLRPLNNESELDRATRIVGDLAVKKKTSKEEQDYLEVLSDLIIKYEDEHHRIDPVSEDRMLAFLIEQKGVTQQQCARDTGIANSTISAVIKGKRKLTREQVEKLCRYFRVNSAAFISMESEATVGAR